MNVFIEILTVNDIFLILVSVIALILIILIVIKVLESLGYEIPLLKRRSAAKPRSSQSVPSSRITDGIIDQIYKLEMLLSIKPGVQIGNFSESIESRLKTIYETVKPYIDSSNEIAETVITAQPDTHELNDVGELKLTNQPIDSPELIPAENDLPLEKDIKVDRELPFLEFYNQAVFDRTLRPDFFKKHPPVKLGNRNSLEQHLGSDVEPDFRETTSGDFLAFRKTHYLYDVVPQFDITITPQNFVPGGFEYAFKCDDYNPNLSYSDVQVKRSAIFQRDGESWDLKIAGELVL